MNKHPVRPVSIASICGPSGHAARFFQLIEQAAADYPDLILLPEFWEDVQEPVDSPTIRRLRAIAKANRCHILHPTILKGDEGRLTNTALLIGRGGEIIGRYDKIYPYWSELDIVSPGKRRQPLIRCDFGMVAVFTCFDANFPDIWEEAALQGAELVLFPSAYGARSQLRAHALNHHYPIVSATLAGYCTAVDIDGTEMLHVKGDSPFIQWVHLDLDRCIFHENFNEDKLSRLLAEALPQVEVEKRLPAEEWIIVRSAREGVSAREACRSAGMEELRAYKQRSRSRIDDMR